MNGVRTMNSKCSDTLDMFADAQQPLADVLDPQKQQSPLVEVGSIIADLENQTTALLSSNPLHGAMAKIMGGCPIEVRKSNIDDATPYGMDKDALNSLACFDLYDAQLKPTGAVFTNPTATNFQQFEFGQGGLFFNRAKLNDAPLIVTDDVNLAFKTTYPVYAPHKQSSIADYTLKALMQVQADIYFIAPIHEKTNIQRRFNQLNVKLAFLDEPPNVVMTQAELDSLIKDAIDGANNATWGELTPLAQVTTTTATPYPIHALPTLAQGAAVAIAEYVQADVAMTAQCVIGAIAHIAQAKVNAPNPNHAHGEPCSLYLLTEGQSGSRKSSCKKLSDQAIAELERTNYDTYKLTLEQWENAQSGLKKDGLKSFLDNNPIPNDTSALFSDGTLEGITAKFIDGWIKAASISSDEAAQFFGGHTMKGDTRTNALGSYTKVFDDGCVERVRSKSNLNGSGKAYDVRLSFNLQGQREILADALNDVVLRGQGFLPRFILTVPENLAGTRLQDAAFTQRNAAADHRLVAYWNRCKSLLDDCPLPLSTDEQENNHYRVMPFSNEAKCINLAFYNECEQAQCKGGRYEHMQPFASRGSQLARRLATCFAYFENEQEITAQNMQGACDIIRHSLGEWLRYADIETKAEGDAQKLIKWIAQKCIHAQTDRLTYSYVQQSCPRPMQKDAKLLAMAIEQLIDAKHCKIEMNLKTRLIVLNPFLLQK